MDTKIWVEVDDVITLAVMFGKERAKVIDNPRCDGYCFQIKGLTEHEMNNVRCRCDRPVFELEDGSLTF